MRVIVTGGGTGGHIYPALAIAQGIMARNNRSKILYVGVRTGMEARLVPAAGFDFKGVSGQGMPRKLNLGMIKAGAKGFRALWETKEILKEFRPDLVVGTGGYVSGPVVLTAALFGIPTLLHEQNALPGVTNKLLGRFVRGVMVTFPESISYFAKKDKVTLTGLPVRPDVGKISKPAGLSHYALGPDRITLLVTGGSRGARTLNQAMITVLEHLVKRPDIQVIWATGSETYQETMQELQKCGLGMDNPRWRIMEYLHDMPEAIAAADLAIGRAGAASLAELMAAGKPCILIPYPYAAENHQEHNARAIVHAGAARLILDQDLNGEVLWQTIRELVNGSGELTGMAAAAKGLAKPDALDEIVQLCSDTGWH